MQDKKDFCFLGNKRLRKYEDLFISHCTKHIQWQYLFLQDNKCILIDFIHHLMWALKRITQVCLLIVCKGRQPLVWNKSSFGFNVLSCPGWEESVKHSRPLFWLIYICFNILKTAAVLPTLVLTAAIPELTCHYTVLASIQQGRRK